MNPGQSSFYITGGTLTQDAPSYVERQADHDLLEGLRAAEFCYVLTSRQMGKSSLMVRTATKLRDGGTGVIALDLTAVGQNVTPEQWYDGLLAQIGRQLRLDDRLEAAWRSNERLGPCQRFFAVIRDAVLPELFPAALVIFVDEIDTVRSLPFPTDEFFAAIRECYNRRGQDPEFRRLTFCLLGVATPSDLIRDTRTTPFNIGRRIELHDFTEEEAAPLAKGLRHSDSGHMPSNVGESNTGTKETKRLLNRVLFWTGGHPYLTQRLCRAITEEKHVRSPADVDRIAKELFFTHRAKERDDNLLFVRDRLLRSETDVPSLLELYLKVRRGEKVADDETSQRVSVLRLSGIVKPRRGRLVARNRIYWRVFDQGWVHAHMPDAEVRRQRAAFYQGVVRTSAIAAVVVAVLTIAVVNAVEQAAKARLARAQAYFSQAQARRGSSLSGQRFESLEALRLARPDFTNAALLRDEAIASLALMDLKATTNGVSPGTQKGPFDVDFDGGTFAEVDANGAVTVRHLCGGQIAGSLPRSEVMIERVHLAPRKPYVLVQLVKNRKGRIIAWDWEKEKELFAIECDLQAGEIAFARDGSRVAVAVTAAAIAIYALPGGEKCSQIPQSLSSGLPRRSRAMDFNPSGELLAVSSGDDQFIEIRSVPSANCVARLYHRGEVNDVSWNPDGELLASACTDGSIYLWNTNKIKEPWKKLSAHENEVLSVAFSHRGNLIASLGRDETVRLWIPATDRLVTCRLKDEGLGRIRFDADDRRLIGIGKNQPRVQTWEVFGGEYFMLRAQSQRFEDFETIDFSPDGRLLAAASSDFITLWDADTGRELGAIPVSRVYAAYFSSDGAELWVSTDSGLHRCPLNRQQIGRNTSIQPGPMTRVGGIASELGPMSLATDRNRAAVMHQSEIILTSLGSPATNTSIAAGERLAKIALHPGGAWIAGASENHRVYLMPTYLTKPADPRRAIIEGGCFAFSPDGRWFAISANAGFQFYQIGNWDKAVYSLPSSVASEQNSPIAFCQDRRMLAVAVSRYKIQLCRLDNGAAFSLKVFATLESPDRNPLRILAFSQDGSRLAAATKNQLIQIWNLNRLREGLAALGLGDDFPVRR